MKRLLSLTLLFLPLTLLSQPSAVKKAADAVLTLTTFKADGSMIATTQGLAIDNDGTAIAPWKPFVGAEKAAVIDAKGTRHEVSVVLGANELYDLVKFRFEGKPAAVLAPGTQHGSAGTQAWVVPNKKSAAPIAAKVESVETFMGNYAYYLLATDATNMQDGCPVVDASGRLLGLFTAGTKTASATDARFAQEFQVNALSQNDPVLRQTNIRIALPTDLQQAQVALVFAQNYGGEKYEAAATDFQRMFPTAIDGYLAQAQTALAKGDTLQATNVMVEAAKKVTDQADYHYQYARLLMQMNRLNEAQQEADAAYALNHEPSYQQLQAQLLFLKGDYQQAYDSYIALTHSPIRNGEPYYQAMLAKEQLGGTDDELLELLDSAIAVCDTPYTVVAAPYFLARALQHDKMEQYRKALPDFYTYEALMYGRLTSDFYYLRSQSELKGRIYQPALNDMAHAVALDPKNALYWAELASLNLRLNKNEEAIMAAQRCIELAPDTSEAYLVLGIALAESGKKAEGIEQIKKAQSLGNEQAATFLQKYR